MEKEYKFISKFVEGKTYKELTDEEIEKLKTGIGVKKEDKEYIDSLQEINENIDNEPKNEVLEVKQDIEIEEEILKEEKVVVQKEVYIKPEKGIEVIKAIGNILKLENGKTVKLNKEQLKEKPFWRKGDVYYG